MQDHPPSWQSDGHLFQPQAQTEAGLKILRHAERLLGPGV